jgi:hypothetical protein
VSFGLALHRSDRNRLQDTQLMSLGRRTGARTADRATLVIDKRDSVVDDLDRGIRAAWGDEILSFW